MQGGREREIDAVQGSFKGSKTISYDTVMVDTRHYTFVKTYGMYIIKSEP